jgi:formyl-CoA transferase
VPEALALEQVRMRGLVQRLDEVDGLDRPLSLVGAGYVMDGGAELSAPPPRLSEHSDEILAGLGCSEADIAQLRAEKVI